MVKGWSAAERQKLRDDVPRLGFKAEIGGRNVLTLAQETLRLCRAGPARGANTSTATAATRRAICGRWRRAIARGITPAEELLEKFHGEWNGSVEPIFEEYAY